MMVVENTSDGVKSEAIYFVLIEVPSQVTEQESLDLVLRVVEHHRVPRAVIASGASMREAMVRTVKVVDAVEHV